MLDLLEQNKDITNLSSFRTPARTKYFFEITNDNFTKLKEVLAFTKINNIRKIFIWSWTNLLFAFHEFDWLIIKNSLKGIQVDWNFVEVYSWELISPFSLKLKNEYNNPVFSAWTWLPWTIGGAIAWNAWCFWLEIKDNFIECELLDTKTWEIVKMDKKAMNFTYRYSLLKDLQDKYFLIKAKFDLNWHLDISNAEDLLQERKNKQPSWFTCGSFFKNSVSNSAGKLIDEAWLKWTRIWWIKISEKHANFFINDQNWTYEDILALKDLAKQKVFEKFGIILEEEVRIITN